jgi:hypothetical protein
MLLNSGGKDEKKVLLLLLVFIIAVPLANVSTYNFNGAKFRTPSNLDYYIGSSVINAGFYTAASHGPNAWDPADNVHITGRTYSKSYAEFRFEYVNKDTGNYASNINECDCFYNDYGNTTLWADFGSLSASREKEVAAHEAGHALGLSHEDDVPSIMYTTKFLDRIYPVTDDWNGMRARY